MANNNITGNDWIATMLTNKDSSVQDLINSGITVKNTTLQDKDTYKETPKIKQMFSDKSGRFDDVSFDKFYNNALHSFNEMSMQTFNEFDNALHSDPSAPKISSSGHFERVYNPNKDLIGVEGLNLKTSGTKSIRELAQNNFVRDFSTGKSLGWKPNDDSKSGLFDFIFKTEPVVIAQYDSEGDHLDPFTGKKVKHAKGDYKLDENGDYYYENLGNREVTDKTFLNMTDTFTDDGSFANKFDFMDSDGLTKSITGSIAKTAAKIAPYFIPGVNYVYTAANVAMELGDALPALSKSLAGIFGSDISNNAWLNKVQGKARSMKGDVSDYSKEHAFSAENLLGIVSDTFEQLFAQRAIASIPSMLGSKTKQISKAYNDVAKLVGETEMATFKGLDTEAKLSTIMKLQNRSADIERLMKSQNLWQTKGAKALSSLYMSATQATQMYEDAKRAGLDQQNASGLYLGTLAGFFGLAQYTEIGHWALDGVGLDDVTKGLRAAVKKEGKEFISPLIRAGQEVGEESIGSGAKNIGKFASAFSAGKELSKKAFKKFTTGSIDNVLEASAAEGIEEVSEEAMQDAFKGVYNTLNDLGLQNKGKKDAQFTFSSDDVFNRYTMSFLGGALGGAIFKLKGDLDAGPKKDQTDKDLFWYMANGYGDKVQSEINKSIDRGEFGPTNLKPNIIYNSEYGTDTSKDFEPTTDKKQSQNDFIGNLLLAKTDQMRSVIDQYGIPSELVLGDEYTKRVQNLIDLGLNSAVKDDVTQISNDIYDLSSQMREMPRPMDTASDIEKEAYTKSLKPLQDKIKEKQKELQEISEGKRLQQYFEEAFFATRPGLNHYFDVKNPNDFSQSLFKKDFNELSDSEKEIVKDRYENYAQYTKRDQLKISKGLFDAYKEQVLKHRDDLVKGANERALNFDFEKMDESIEKMELEGENQAKSFIDFINKFKETTTEGGERLSILDTPFNIDNDILNAKASEVLKSDNLENLKDVPVINALARYNVIVKEQGIPAFKTLRERMQGKADESILVGHVLKNPSSAPVEFINKKLSALTQEDINNLGDTIDPETKNQLQFAFDNKQQIISESEKLLNKAELKKENPSFTLGLLKDLTFTSNDDVEAQKVSNVFDILRKAEKKIVNPTFDISSFIINNKVEEKSIEKAIDTIDKLGATLSQLTRFNGDNNKNGTLISATDKILKLNDQESPYEGLGFDQETAIKIGQELKYYRSKLEFMLNVSSLNKGNKVKYDKIASTTYKSAALYSLLPQLDGDEGYNKIYEEVIKEADPDFYNDIQDDVSKFQTLISAYANGELENLSYHKFSVDMSDDQIKDLEKTIFNIQSYIHNRINSNPELKSKIMASINSEEKWIKLKGIVDAEDSPTKYNSNIENFSGQDVLNELFNIINTDPKEINSRLIGQTDKDGSDFDKTPYAPLQSQENIIRHTISLLSSINDNDNPIVSYFSNLKSDIFQGEQNEISPTLETIFPYAINILGYPGSGKTTVTSIISRITEQMGKKIMALAPLKDVGNNLLKIIGDRDNVVNKNKSTIVSDYLRSIFGDEIYNKILDEQNNQKWYDHRYGDPLPANVDRLLWEVQYVDKNPKNSKEGFILNTKHNLLQDAMKKISDSKFKIDADLIVIDEFTHLSTADIQLLNLLSDTYNSTHDNKFMYIFTGDLNQKGFKLKMKNGSIIRPNSMYCYQPAILTDMIRSGYNNKIDNISNTLSLLQSVQKAGRNGNQVAKDNPIVFNYTETEDGLIGEKIVDNYSSEQLIDLANNSQKVGVIVDSMNDDIVKQIQSLPPDSQLKFDIKTKFDIRINENVQGSEFDMSIIAVKEPPVVDTDINSAKRALESLYTYISRSKKGSVVFKSAIANGLNITSMNNGDDSKAEFKQEQLQDYKKLRSSILNDNKTEGVSIKQQTIKQAPDNSKSQSDTWDAEKVLKMFQYTFDDVEKPVMDVENQNYVEPSEFGKDKAYMYPFHERDCFRFKNNVYTQTSAYSIDSVCLAKDKSELKDLSKLKELKKDVKVIKSAVINHALTMPNDDFEMPDEIASKYPNIDFSKFDLILESVNTENSEGEYVDKSSIGKGKVNNGNKRMHFLNIRFKDINGDSMYFTLAALPDINNPNVIQQPGIANLLNELNQQLDDSGNKEMFRKINVENPLSIIKRLSGIKYNNLEKPVTIESFKEDHPELTFSPTYIVTREYEQLYSKPGSDPNKIRKFLGKPVIFVTHESGEGFRPEELKDEYERQLIKKSNDSSFNMTVSAMFVANRKVDAFEWLETNKKFISNVIKKRNHDSYNAIYESHFTAGQMLANIIQNANYLQYLWDKRQTKQGLDESQEKTFNSFYTNDPKTQEINNALISHINTRVGQFDLDGMIKQALNELSNKDPEVRKNARQKVYDTIIAKVQKAYDSEDLTKSSLFKYLQNASGDEYVRRLFSSPLDAKSTKYTSMLISLFYKPSDSRNSEEFADLENQMDLFKDQFKYLIRFGNQYSDGMVSLHSLIEKSNKNQKEVPFLCKAVNKDSDVMVVSDVLAPNIYIDLSNLESISIDQSDQNSKLERQKKLDNLEVLNLGKDFINKIDSEFDIRKPQKELFEQIFEKYKFTNISQNNSEKSYLIKNQTNEKDVRLNFIKQENGQIIYVKQKNDKSQDDILVNDPNAKISFDQNKNQMNIELSNGNKLVYDIDSMNLVDVINNINIGSNSLMSKNLATFVDYIKKSDLQVEDQANIINEANSIDQQTSDDNSFIDSLQNTLDKSNSNIQISRDQNNVIQLNKVELGIPEINPETTINIYAGTGENSHLSNFAERPFYPRGDYDNDDDSYDIFFKYHPFLPNIFSSVEEAFQYFKFMIPMSNTSYASDVYLGLNLTQEEKESENYRHGKELNEVLDKIYYTRDPVEKKRLGNTKGLLSKEELQEWDKNSSELMKYLIKQSFEQNPKALKQLLDTGNATLTHTQDKGKWGILFPKILMEVRDELRKKIAQQPKPKYEQVAPKTQALLNFDNDFTRTKNKVSESFQAIRDLLQEGDFKTMDKYKQISDILIDPSFINSLKRIKDSDNALKALENLFNNLKC